MFHFIISPFRSFQRRSSLHCLVCIRGIPHISLLTAAGRLPTRATTGLATTGLATVVQQRTGNPLHLGMSSFLCGRLPVGFREPRRTDDQQGTGNAPFHHGATLKYRLGGRLMSTTIIQPALSRRHLTLVFYCKKSLLCLPKSISTALIIFPFVITQQQPSFELSENAVYKWKYTYILQNESI